MCSVRCAICINSVVGVAVVGNLNNLVAVSLSSLNNILNALVYSLYSLLDSLIYACVTNHIAICKVKADEVVFLLAKSRNQLILNLVCRHLWL